MTKTLTEQWREGTIDYGLYYVKVIGRSDITIADTKLDEELNVEEVLAPVPSYEEYNDLIQQNVNQGSTIETRNKQIEVLQKELEITTKALSDIEDGYYESTGAGQTVRQALKEMEGVK